MRAARLRVGRCALPGPADVLTLVCRTQRRGCEDPDAAATLLGCTVLHDVQRTWVE
jgi:hypothetical protein